MKKSDSIKNVADALQKFAMVVGKVKKDSNNPFFNSKYASLSNILQEIAAPLQECNLILTQFPDGLNGLTTILAHTPSGEFLESTYEMTPAKNDPQGSGSAITYMRRYAIQSILCINIEEDDDANTASNIGSQKQPSSQQQNQNSDERPWLTEALLNKAIERIKLGEQGVYEKTDAAFRMKKQYREQLKNA